MPTKCFLGIDTSNYTTSAALVGEDGALIANLKIPLSVEAGERGLRQSEALFLHTKNLPELMTRVHDTVLERCLEVLAVGVSSRPRNKDGSYMPCFLAGLSAASAASAASGARLYEFSHQCGHVAAAIYSSGAEELFDIDEIGAFHVSGGTTELLLARAVEGGFDSDIVGGTADLNAGQAIDRIGVYMGLAFPCGAEMERLAMTNTKRIPKARLSINGCRFNLSGLENKATALFDDSGDAALVSAYVLDFIARAAIESSLEFRKLYGEMPMVYAGGVMSNSIIKSRILERIPRAYFAEPAMSSDNAVGAAVLARRSYFEEDHKSV